jgi:hypothetical protein
MVPEKKRYTVYSSNHLALKSIHQPLKFLLVSQIIAPFTLKPRYEIKQKGKGRTSSGGVESIR